MKKILHLFYKIQRANFFVLFFLGSVLASPYYAEADPSVKIAQAPAAAPDNIPNSEGPQAAPPPGATAGGVVIPKAETQPGCSAESECIPGPEDACRQNGKACNPNTCKCEASPANAPIHSNSSPQAPDGASGNTQEPSPANTQNLPSNFPTAEQQTQQNFSEGGCSIIAFHSETTSEASMLLMIGFASLLLIWIRVKIKSVS